jgi:protein ImuB
LLLDKPSGAASTHDDELRGLATWALQWTPRVTIVDEAVCMEVEASLRLFGGPEALRERVGAEAAELAVEIVAWSQTCLTA